MTISAYGSLPVAVSNGLAVDALGEFLLDLLMALGASRRRVELEDCRLGIARAQDLMGSMAITANRSLVGSRGNRAPVHALLIREKRLALCPLAAITNFCP